MRMRMATKHPHPALSTALSNRPGAPVRRQRRRPTHSMPVNAQTIGHMSAQWGLITRQQAICSGMSRDEIDRLARSRRWTAVRRGVYAESAYVALLTSHAQRRLLADRAASLRVSAPHVLSHHSAAYLLDLGVLHEARPFTHLTRPGVVGSHLRHGVKHHLAPYRAEDVTTAQGVSLLGPARTALDIAREQGYRSGLVAADSALCAEVPPGPTSRAPSG